MDLIDPTKTALQTLVLLYDVVQEVKDRNKIACDFLETLDTVKLILEQIRRGRFDSAEITTVVCNIENIVKSSAEDIQKKSSGILRATGINSKIKEYDDRIRKELATLQLLLSVVAKSSKRNVVRDIREEEAKKFWAERFGAEHSMVHWNDFWNYVKESFPGIASAELQIRNLLDVDSDNQVHISEFKRFITFFVPFRSAFYQAACLQYYHNGISGEEAKALLRAEPAGAFLLRFSRAVNGYVVSYKLPDDSIKHQQLNRYEQVQKLFTTVCKRGIPSKFDTCRYEETAIEMDEPSDQPLDLKELRIVDD